jgi:hypothetical protein
VKGLLLTVNLGTFLLLLLVVLCEKSILLLHLGNKLFNAVNFGLASQL